MRLPNVLVHKVKESNRTCCCVSITTVYGYIHTNRLFTSVNNNYIYHRLLKSYFLTPKVVQECAKSVSSIGPKCCKKRVLLSQVKVVKQIARVRKFRDTM